MLGQPFVTAGFDFLIMPDVLFQARLLAGGLFVPYFQFLEDAFPVFDLFLGLFEGILDGIPGVQLSPAGFFLRLLGLTGRIPGCLPGCLLRLFGRYMAKRSPESRTFSYLWSHIQPLSPDKAGTELDMSLHLAWHTSEFWFTFGSLAKGIPPHRPWREEDFRLAEIVTSYWANFIKTGDPNAEGLPFWPESGDHYGYLEIMADPKGTDGLNGDLDRLCREFVMAEYKLSD